MPLSELFSYEGLLRVLLVYCQTIHFDRFQMDDVKHLKDKGIPLKIDGCTRFVKGATKYTTCGDVIKMVLKKTGVRKEYRHLFSIYEVSYDVEKALPCKSRIVKVISTWRGEPHKLVLRKADPLTPLVLNEKTKKWNLKRKSNARAPEVNTPYIQTLSTLADMIEKRKADGCSGISNDIPDSTSDSDSSMDEFLSKLNRSKMVGLINLFAAIAMKKQKRASQRTTGRVVNESDDSSDVSPARTKRTHRSTKHHSLKERKSEISNSRLKESADMHPKKLHAIHRVNFGFIDVEPRSQDRVYSLSDVCPIDEHKDKMRSNSNSVFTARRRLIPGKTPSCNTEIPRSCTEASDGCNAYVDPYKIRTLEMCPEIWCESPIHSADSGHAEDSDSSTDLDTAFVLRRNACNVTKTSKHVDIVGYEHFSAPLNYKPTTSSARKLVEYSITDDELSDYDNDDDEADGELAINSEYISNVNEEQEMYNRGRFHADNLQSDNCAYYLKNDNNPGLEVKTDITDYIKSIFDKTFANEDDEMNSFMNSMMLDESSDDGLSSMASDLEKDVRL